MIYGPFSIVSPVIYKLYSGQFVKLSKQNYNLWYFEIVTRNNLIYRLSNLRHFGMEFGLAISKSILLTPYCWTAINIELELDCNSSAFLIHN